MAEYILPPIYLWAAAGILLFLCQLFLLRKFKVDVPGFPSLALGCGFMVLLSVGAAISLGIGVFVFLFAPVILLACRAVLSINVKAWPDSFIKVERGFSIVVFIILAGLLGAFIYIHMTRSQVDYILKYPGSPWSRQWTKAMATQGKDGLVNLRIIATQGRPFAASEALAILADHGSAAQDVPIAIQALRRAYQEKNAHHRESDDWNIESIETSLRKLSRLDLSKGTKPDDWEIIWKERPDSAPLTNSIKSE